MAYRPWIHAAVSVVCLLTLAGCPDDSNELGWRIRYADDTLRDRTRVIVVDIFEGGCSGSPRWNHTLPRNETTGEFAEATADPPELAAGTYGIRARAQDESCAIVAEECQQVELPFDEDVLVLTLAAGGGQACSPAECLGGVCRGMVMEDGGQMLPDTGPPVECTGEGTSCMDEGMTQTGVCRMGTCCFGCWDGTTCHFGAGAEACGVEGGMCEVCGPGNRCVTGSCQNRTNRATFDLETNGSFLRLPDDRLYISDNDAFSQRGSQDAGSGNDFDAFMETPNTFVDVAANELSACGINSQGILHCWGNNQAGTVGIGGVGGSVQTPTPVAGIDLRFSEVEGGNSHFCAIEMNGLLYCWGGDTLGFGFIGTTSPDRTRPQRVAGGGFYRQVTALVDHTCAIQYDGSLWCWGRNDNNQLGVGGGNQNTPQHVGMETDWVDISVGNVHTCGIRDDGGDRTLWCWGSNASGQLGLDDTTARPTPTMVPGTGWAQVSAGAEYVCAIRDIGGEQALLCWGFNIYNMLGTGSAGPPRPERVGTAQWQSIASSWRHTCGVQMDGTFWCWGDNLFQFDMADVGKAGTGSTEPSVMLPETIVLDPPP